MAEIYGASTVKRRRRSDAELAELDAAIVEAVETEHPVTLRGVYYRVVSAGAVDKTENGYRLVGRQLLKLRRSSVIPYDRITDGTRWIRKPDTWTDLDEMLDDASASYRRALWHRQQVDVHLFTEKDAITGVIWPVTAQWDVPLGVLRGYSSETFAHSMAQAVMAARKPVYVYQLGDHDPSGVGAWEDFEAKVTGFLGEGGGPFYDGQGREGRLFIRDDYSMGSVYFERLAVTVEQIEQWDLPTRPTKTSDTRSAGWSGGSVEVDAIPPTTLRHLVEDAITEHVDPEALRLTRFAERSEREILLAMKGQRGPVGYGGGGHG